MLMLTVIERFSKAECCEMVLLSDECGRNAWLIAKLYWQLFLACSHPSYQTTLTVVKCLTETGCVTNKAWPGRLAKVGLQDQLDEVLTYSQAYPKCSKRQINQHYVLSKSQVWKIVSKLGSHAYRPTLQQVLLDGMVSYAMHGETSTWIK